MKELVKKSLWRLILSYIYAFLGGCVFYFIERKPETNKEAYSRLSRELHQDFTNQFNISINESDFTRFMQRAFEAVTIGNKADWSIISGLSFTMTSLTTIGFGHITPETPLGQVFTVLYCFVGLPISMLTLKALGEVVSKIVYKFVYLVETRVLCRKRPRKVKIKTFFTTFTLMILTLCGGGLTQMYLEDWTFIEGVYGWFATLSTIGYGDYVPSLDFYRKAESSVPKISLWVIISASALPCLAGLCVVSGVLNSLVEALEEFRIHFNVQCSRCENTKSAARFKEEPQNGKFVNGHQKESEDEVGLTMINERERSATF